MGEGDEERMMVNRNVNKSFIKKQRIAGLGDTHKVHSPFTYQSGKSKQRLPKIC